MATMVDLLIRDATFDDLGAMLAIYNEQVLTSTSTFDLRERSQEAQHAWFLQHQEGLHPVVVGERAGQVVAWGSLSVYKPRPAYQHTVEVSVYVHQQARSQGLGTVLLKHLCERGQSSGVHTIVAYIVSSNQASLRMSRACGFVEAGRLREVGYKFDTWLDVVIMQRILHPSLD